MKKALLLLLLMITCDGSAIPLKPMVRWGGAGTAIIGALTALAMHNRVRKLTLRRKALLLLREQARDRSVQERFQLLNALLLAERQIILATHYRRLGLLAAGAGVSALGGSFLMRESDSTNDDTTNAEKRVSGQDFTITSGILPADISSAPTVPVSDDVISGALAQLHEKIESKDYASREVQSIFKTLLHPINVPADNSCGIHMIEFWHKWQSDGPQALDKKPTFFSATRDQVARQRSWLMDEVERHINDEISHKDTIIEKDLFFSVAIENKDDIDIGPYYWVRQILADKLVNLDPDKDLKPFIRAALANYKDVFGKKGSTDWLDVSFLPLVAKEMKCPILVWAKNAKTGGFDISEKINFEGWDGDLSKICHGVNLVDHWVPAILKPEVIALLRGGAERNT